MRIALVVLLLSSLALAQTQPQRKSAAPPKAAPVANPAAESPVAAAPQPDAPAEQQRIEAARRDIQRMRNLVEQMDRNRAFASPGETPLNHEFQLNVELWRTLLDRLDRDLAPPPAPPKPAPQL